MIIMSPWERWIWFTSKVPSGSFVRQNIWPASVVLVGHLADSFFFFFFFKGSGKLSFLEWIFAPSDKYPVVVEWGVLMTINLNWICNLNLSFISKTSAFSCVSPNRTKHRKIAHIPFSWKYLNFQYYRQQMLIKLL